MCLEQHNFLERFPRYTFKPLTVYKVLYKRNPKYMPELITEGELEVVHAPFQRFSYFFGEEYRTLVKNKKGMSGLRVIREVENGYHSLPDKQSAFRMLVHELDVEDFRNNVTMKDSEGYRLVDENGKWIWKYITAVYECIIPAGTKYYTGVWGYDNAYRNIASAKLIVVKEVSRDE